MLWLDADDISTLYQDSAATTPVTTDGQNVGAWIDKSTGTAKAVQSTATKYPFYKTGVRNSKDGILFDGSNDYLTIPDLTIDGEVTVIVVMQAIDNGATQIPIVCSKNTGDTYYFWLSLDALGNGMAGHIYDTGDRSVNLAADPTGANIFAMTNTEGSPISVYRGGAKTDGVINTGTFGTQGASKLGIWRDSVNYPFSGHIFEVMIYDHQLSEAELILLWDYLGEKWAIPSVQDTIGDPLSIADSIFWFDASSVTCIDSDPVFVIPDLTGNAYHAIQQTLTKQGLFKTNIQNGLSAVLMDGSDDFYTLLSQIIDITDAISVFGVFKIVDHSPASDPMLIGFTDDDATEPWVLEFFYSVPGDSDEFYPVTYADGTTYDPRPSGTPIGAHVFGATAKESDEIVGYLDGSTASEAITGVFDHGAYTSQNAKIGANIDGLSRWMNGYICELMAWSKELTAGEVTTVINYLTNKWGIS